MTETSKLAQALVKAQGEFSAIPKTETNPFFKSKYADLATVVESASPILTKNGLAVTQEIGFTIVGETVYDTLTTTLIHESGEQRSDTMILKLSKQDAQGQGSATTYARRYSYMAVLGLVADEDDDGNKASTHTATTAQTAPKASTANAVSAKQALMIADLLKQKFTSKEDAQGWLVGAIGSTSPTNSAEASTVIDGLMKLAKSTTAPRLANKPLPSGDVILKDIPEDFLDSDIPF
jgi:hypothetical protein